MQGLGSSTRLKERVMEKPVHIFVDYMPSYIRDSPRELI